MRVAMFAGVAMPSTRAGRLAARARVSTRERLRRRFGKIVVTREVAGAKLAMPWAHRLPDYVKAFPSYGRNLVDLAEALHGAEPLKVIDIGANIGDSALQILARVDARILCVDGDPYWLPFLRRNTGDEARIALEAALVVEQVGAATLAPVRQSGTTRFVSSAAPVGAAQITSQDLRDRHPEFADVRLIKSDIDGYDCRVVPLLARAWTDADPVLFFEYDPGLTRRTGDDHPERIWDELERLGYVHAAVWTNFGTPVGHGYIADLRAASDVFARPDESRAYDYWDVALAKDADSAAAAAFRQLAPEPLTSP
jgi:FkbM family methyltransferase